MFRRGDFSTETDKGPFAFAAAAFGVCLAAAVLLFVLGKGEGLAVFAGILLSLVAMAAGAVLFAMVSDRAYILEDTLHMEYLFRRARIPLKEIGKVSLKEDVYSVYDKRGKLAGTINAKLTGIDKVLLEMDRKKVPFV